MSDGGLPPEEQARADFYALLARLFYAPPDRGLLDLLSGVGDLEAAGPDSGLAHAWRELRAAASTADVEAVREEYESLFVGTGKAPVTLYTSAHVQTSDGRNPLASLREFMASQGLARRADAFEPEDHLAALCDMMRHLVVRQCGIDVERRLFGDHLGPAMRPLCGAIDAAESARFYRQVAAFAQAFFNVEHEAFEIQ